MKSLKIKITPDEAKKIFSHLLTEKKRKAEYFQEHGTLKGFVPSK